MIHLKDQSCFLFGKDRRVNNEFYNFLRILNNPAIIKLSLKKVADVPLDHPSISNQHSVVQFREICKEDDCGNYNYIVKPYIMDLESTNGTFLNGERMDSARYYELKHGDVVKFAGSTRDYVIMKQK